MGCRAASRLRTGGRHDDEGADPRFIIDGKRNPEVFLFELMDFLLGGVSGPVDRQEGFRRTVSDEIAAAGWVHEEFWRELERIRDAVAPPFARVPRDRFNEPSVEMDGRQECAGRARALVLAREHFGREAFDRFLYRAVAPKLMAFADVPTTAEQLRAAEEGCR